MKFLLEVAGLTIVTVMCFVAPQLLFDSMKYKKYEEKK